MFTNISSIIQESCFLFSANSASTAPNQGSVNKLRVDGLDCDGVGNGNAIQFDSTVNTTNGVATASFSHFTTQTPNAPNAAFYPGGALEIDGTGSVILFSDFQSTFMSCNGASILGSGNTVTFVTAYMQNWGMQNTSCPAFSANRADNVKFASTPIFDNSQNTADVTRFGGTLYTLSNGPAAPVALPIGLTSGTLNDLTNKQVAFVVAGSGLVGLVQSGAEFVNAGGGADATIIANTPSGKIGVGYSTTQASYVIYNNTGGQINFYGKTDSLDVAN